MPFSIEDLHRMDANQHRDRPVLPAGDYEVELGAFLAKPGKSNKGDDYLRVSSKLTPTKALTPDIKEAAQSWGGEVYEMLEQASVWFTTFLYEEWQAQKLRKKLAAATGLDPAGSLSAMLERAEGLKARARVEVGTWDGMPRNEVLELLPV